LKESAATAPPPRRDRHGGSGRGSGSAAMDISVTSIVKADQYYG